MISRNRKSIARTLGTDHDPCKGEPWQARAACVGHDPELWYPTGSSGTNGIPANYSHARAICAVCPVRSVCIEDAITSGDSWGVRGGLSPEQLTAIIKDHVCQDCHRAPAKRSSTRCGKCAREHELDLERNRSRRRRAMGGAA